MDTQTDSLHIASELAHLRDLQMVFGTEIGRRVLIRLEQDFGGMSFDPHNQKLQDFREGQRHVVAVLRRRLAMTPEDVTRDCASAAFTEGDPYGD